MRHLLIALLAATPAIAAQPVTAEGAKPVKVAEGFGLCDGPAYDGRYALYVPDVLGGKLFRFIPKTQKNAVLAPEAGRISATFYNRGRLYLSDNGNAAIAYWDFDKKQKMKIAGHDPTAKPPARPNDLVVDHNGRIYYTLTRQNQVWTIGPDGEHKIAIEKIATPNGITLSPDGKTLYVAAYAPKEIWAYDAKADGSTANGRLLAKMDDGPDKGADGMTTDRTGNIYCAGARDVWVWTPAGKLIEKITTPTRPINAAFAGPDPQKLYITCLFSKDKTIPSAMYAIDMRVNGVSPTPDPTAGVEGTRPSTGIPANITARLNVTYARYGDRKLLADIFVPKADGPRPAVVVVHGGGWLKGDKMKFRALAIALAKRGYVAAAIEYRLGNEAKFPAAIHDCNAAVRHLRANATEYDLDPQRIGAVGGSAGGHLVGLMATGWKLTELQGEGGFADRTSRLQAAIVMAGPMEIDTGSVAERSMTGKANANTWIGGNVETNAAGYQLASAHRHIDKDSSPILFMVGEHDKPERNQPSRNKLKAAGVWTDVKVYRDGKHGCWNQLPWFNDMVADMDAFFKDKLGDAK